MTRLRSPAASASFGEARGPASAKATAVRRSFSEGGSASGAEAAASPKDERRATLFGSTRDERRATLLGSTKDERRATLSASPKSAGEPERLALHGEPKNECRATLPGSPNRPLRIAIIAPYDLSADGGINSQIRAQARALRGLGHVVQIAGPASGPLQEGELPLGGSVAVTLGGTESGLGVDPRAFGAVGRLLQQAFDVVHVHEPLTPLVPWIVLARARAPLVGTFHVHREEGHPLYTAWAWALRPLARRLRARIAVSDAARRTVAAHFSAEYEIVPNGIDTDTFRLPRPRPVEMPADRRIVLYVGRLELRKGVEYLIHAMPRVQQRVRDALLLVIGDGADRVRLASLAADLGAAALFSGRVADEDLPAYYQSADIVCSPALGGESFGVVLLEAMASGTAIVASRIDGYEALVRATEAARLVPPGDVEALATEIVALLESAERRRALAENGAALAREHDWHTLAPRLVAIYRRIIGASRE